MQRLASVLANAQQRLIEPHSLDPDSRRREFITNVLVAGLTVVAVLALLSSTANHLAGNATNHGDSRYVTATFLAVMIGLWRLSRIGHYRVVAGVFLACIALAALNLVLLWSFELPEAELACVLIIVIGGVLFTARAAIVITGLTSAVVLLLGYLQVYNVLHPQTTWLDQKIELSDMIGVVVVFFVIGLVSWLANREIDRSLIRARTSETALAKERDSLEIKVLERTQELEQEQLRRLLTVQRFAEFGRLSSGLLHEIANPLTAASLNLEAMNDQRSEQIVEARKNLNRLERYLQAARKQLLGESKISTFSVRSEINQVIRLLKPRARELGVELVLELHDNPKLRGDAVKFSQLVSNLVANAIEAYEGSAAMANKRVVIAVGLVGGKVELQVTDWGKGIPRANLKQVFEPFFSTKSASNRGMGIGLAMVKQFAEEAFGGSISVSSSAASGTRFVVQLCSQEKP